MVAAVWAALLRDGGALYCGPLDSDLVNQFYPWRVFIHRWITRGVFPFWDPHVFGGYPTLETQQMLALNPVHLATLWMPPNLGLITMTALNTLIGCVGMAWGLWRWGRCSAIAASLGAGLYVFGALFAVRVMAGHFTVVAALAWWPLAALSVLRISRCVRAGTSGSNTGHVLFGVLRRDFSAWIACWRLRSVRRLMAASAIAHAMVCLAGGPQYIVYLFYVDLAIVAAASRRRAWIPALGVVAAVWVLALAVSAPQWLPAMTYLPLTGRALSSGGATGFSLSSIYNIWFETMLPFPFGDDMNHGHLHFKNVWETALYPGSVALVLSATLLLRVADWFIRRFLKRAKPWRGNGTITPLGLAGIVMSIMGIYMMAGGWLPGFSSFREPAKARAIVAFGFAVMSAAAFNGIARRPYAWRRVMIGGALIAYWGIGAASQYTDIQEFKNLVIGFGTPFDPQATATYNKFLSDPREAMTRYYTSCLWATAGIFFTALWLIKFSKLPRVALTMLFLGALLDPFLAHATAWMGRHPWSRAGLPKPVEEFFEPRLAANTGELPWRVVLNSGIINRTHHIDGLFEVHGYDPLMPALASGRMLVKGMLETPNEQRALIRSELLGRVGVRYDARTALEAVKTGEDPTSSTQVMVVPKATLFDVSRKVVAGSPGSNTFGAALDGTHYVLPANLGGLVSEVPEVPADFQEKISGLPHGEADDTSETSQLLPGESIEHLETGRPDEFGVHVQLTRPALLVYKGTWTPGWRALIDGEDQGQALFANNWMSGAIVPKGRHTVLFRYRPVLWVPSLMLSGLGVIGLFTLYAGWAILAVSGEQRQHRSAAKRGARL